MKLEEVNEDLKLGDVVILKSGGESMTVTHIEEKKTGGFYVECTWFEGPYANQVIKNGIFPIEALKKDAVAPIGIKPTPSVIIPVTGNLLVAPFTETKAKEAQREAAKSLQKEVEAKEDLGQGVSLEMVLIPAGKFVMGSPENETQHEVTLTKPFYIGKYEVTQERWEAVMGENVKPKRHINRRWRYTQEQWEAVMGENPSATEGAKLPVTNVSWEDCQEFIKKLNTITNANYRLPTEAEWEYACRAGTSTAYSFGDSLTKGDANIDGDGTKAVGIYKPNAFGLYDMHGNVWEWCQDWHAVYNAEAVTDPVGPATGEFRILRGGCSSARYLNSPTNRSGSNGLRLARTAL